MAGRRSRRLLHPPRTRAGWGATRRPSDKLNIAGIGVGGMGLSNLRNVESENIVTLAASPNGAILYVVSTEREGHVRIITARYATSHERRIYQEGD